MVSISWKTTLGEIFGGEKKMFMQKSNQSKLNYDDNILKMKLRKINLFSYVEVINNIWARTFTENGFRIYVCKYQKINKM